MANNHFRINTITDKSSIVFSTKISKIIRYRKKIRHWTKYDTGIIRHRAHPKFEVVAKKFKEPIIFKLFLACGQGLYGLTFCHHCSELKMNVLLQLIKYSTRKTFASLYGSRLFSCFLKLSLRMIISPYLRIEFL